MINFEEKILGYGGFQLEVYPLMFEPADEDFNEENSKCGMQCGADFHLSYNGKYSHNPTLGILQFVRSPKKIGNQPHDVLSDICLDARINDSDFLIDYLFGNPETNISYQNTRFVGKPTTVRGINSCEIYDTPREVYEINNKILAESPIKIEFWDFVVGIDVRYCHINPIGIKWDLIFTQIENENKYTCEVEFSDVDFRQMNYKDVFQSVIAAGTYDITESLRK